MRKRGIKCAKQEEMEMLAARKKGVPDHCSGNFTDACKGCALYTVIPSVHTVIPSEAEGSQNN